jgi:hypothetical protein
MTDACVVQPPHPHTGAATAQAAATRLVQGVANAAAGGSGGELLTTALADWCGGWDGWPAAVAEAPLGVAALACRCVG